MNPFIITPHAVGRVRLRVNADIDDPERWLLVKVVLYWPRRQPILDEGQPRILVPLSSRRPVPHWAILREALADAQKFSVLTVIDEQMRSVSFGNMRFRLIRSPPYQT